MKRERDSLDSSSELTGKDKRMMKKQIDDLTKNGVQLLNDKKQLQKEVAMLQAEKDELKKLISDGGGSPFASAANASSSGAEGPPSPLDGLASSSIPPIAPPPGTSPTQPSAQPGPDSASGADPVLFPSLAGKYKDQPPAITPTRPAPARPAPVSAEHQKLKELIRGGKFDEAVRRADQYLTLAPGDPQLLLMKGLAATRTGQFDAAVDALKRLTSSVPRHENGWVLLGTAYMAQKNTWKASESFHKALAINPDSPEANYNMAQILVSVEDVAAARQCYMKSLQAGGQRDAALEKRLNR